MAAEDKRLSAARREVSLWNQDRRIGFRGSKGYGITRSYYHRAERRHFKNLCETYHAPDVSRPIPELYVHGISDPMRW